MATHSSYPNMWEVETEGLPQVQDQPGLQVQTKQNKKDRRNPKTHEHAPLLTQDSLCCLHKHSSSAVPLDLEPQPPISMNLFLPLGLWYYGKSIANVLIIHQ